MGPLQLGDCQDRHHCRYRTAAQNIRVSDPALVTVPCPLYPSVRCATTGILSAHHIVCETWTRVRDPLQIRVPTSNTAPPTRGRPVERFAVLQIGRSPRRGPCTRAPRQLQIQHEQDQQPSLPATRTLASTAPRHVVDRRESLLARPPFPPKRWSSQACCRLATSLSLCPSLHLWKELPLTSV